MAGLLVSVRSVVEARAALAGGAAVIDIKEPDFGPLGRSPTSTWKAVRAEVPQGIPVSVALGELADLDLNTDAIPCADFAGIAFRKAGPARMQSSWPSRWQQARQASSAKAGWVAVIYADWNQADAPHPDEVIAAAIAVSNCPGILIDSWDKTAGCPIDDLGFWGDRVKMIQNSGRFVALSGCLTLDEIERLHPLRPDLFAVRGAACLGNRRGGTIDSRLVASLVEAAATPCLI